MPRPVSALPAVSLSEPRHRRSTGDPGAHGERVAALDRRRRPKHGRGRRHQCPRHDRPGSRRVASGALPDVVKATATGDELQLWEEKHEHLSSELAALVKPGDLGFTVPRVPNSIRLRDRHPEWARRQVGGDRSAAMAWVRLTAAARKVMTWAESCLTIENKGEFQDSSSESRLLANKRQYIVS